MLLYNCGTLRKIHKKSEACKALLQVNFDAAQEAIKGDKSQSLLFYGCRLAKQLKSFNHPNKWEVISEVWVEMLTYAANKCTWKEHGQQLRKGGELLTHVRLLMVHLGLSEQYRIQTIKFDEENIRYLKPGGFLLLFCVCFCMVVSLPIMFLLIITLLCCDYLYMRWKCYKEKRDTSQV